MELINIENKDGQLLVSSREVAENFGKEHKDVLEAVRNLIAENSAVNEMVFESSYTSDRGREYPEYLLNRDGFTLLAMGFTGDKALQWKLKYINAFNQMENSIKQQTIPSDLSPQLQLLINMELKQKEMEKAVIETKQEIQGMRDVITLSTSTWRTDTTLLINKIARKLGGHEHIKEIRSDSYKTLDERMGVDTNIRLINKRRRMAEEGISKTNREKTTILDVIADDKKLIEGYTAIIKEMAIKHGVA